MIYLIIIYQPLNTIQVPLMLYQYRNNRDPKQEGIHRSINLKQIMDPDLNKF